MSVKARKTFLRQLEAAVQDSGRFRYSEEVSPTNSSHVRVTVAKVGAKGAGAETHMDIDKDRAFSVWPSVCGIYKVLFGHNHAEWPQDLPLMKAKKIEQEMVAAADAVVAPIAAAPRPSRLDIAEMMKTQDGPRGSFAAIDRFAVGEVTAPAMPEAEDDICLPEEPAKRPIIGISMSDEAFTGRPAGSANGKTIVVRTTQRTPNAAPRTWREVKVTRRRIGERPIEYRM